MNWEDLQPGDVLHYEDLTHYEVAESYLILGCSSHHTNQKNVTLDMLCLNDGRRFPNFDQIRILPISPMIRVEAAPDK